MSQIPQWKGFEDRKQNPAPFLTRQKFCSPSSHLPHAFLSASGPACKCCHRWEGTPTTHTHCCHAKSSGRKLFVSYRRAGFICPVEKGRHFYEPSATNALETQAFSSLFFSQKLNEGSGTYLFLSSCAVLTVGLPHGRNSPWYYFLVRFFNCSSRNVVSW